MKRILIANRGEIAVRIIRACREMGLSPIAVCSEADRESLHVSLADAFYRIGPPPAAQSYLNAGAILATARESGADAIHPGYGFLSERADFARACEEAGIRFIGPGSEAIRLLGDKIQAKRLMESAGVPVLPGYSGDDQEDARFVQEAAATGYPLLVKAAAGGGGRGMRLVRSPEELVPALRDARGEALAGFGDSRLMLERYIERARHVEVQIFGDAGGTVIHLGERECSIQRRHQKIIEESPCPILTPELREQMTSAAVAAGKAAGYENAGTVEFLLEERPDGDHRFYFLEVNTRLQVEHPVTEMRTGIDLVKLQIRVARGEPLPLKQTDVRLSGHAMEARIYAEDPARGFLPDAGRLEQWIEPTGPWVRVDSGFERRDMVPPHYDPLLAKLIVWGQDRAEALARMRQALSRFHVLGPRVNTAYLTAILQDPAFERGDTHTGFLKERFEGWTPPGDLPEEALLALAALSALEDTAAPSVAAESAADLFSPWRDRRAWRALGGPA